MALAIAGCGSGSEDAGSTGGAWPTAEDDRYPLVPDPHPGFVMPTSEAAAPAPTCERRMVRFRDGSDRPIVFPPPPGLRAQATSDRDVLVSWSVSDLPSDCQPALILIAIQASDFRVPPTVVEEPVEASTGAVKMTYPLSEQVAPAPANIASASFYVDDGRASRTVTVLVRR